MSEQLCEIAVAKTGGLGLDTCTGKAVATRSAAIDRRIFLCEKHAKLYEASTPDHDVVYLCGSSRAGVTETPHE